MRETSCRFKSCSPYFVCADVKTQCCSMVIVGAMASFLTEGAAVNQPHLCTNSSMDRALRYGRRGCEFKSYFVYSHADIV